MAKEAYPAEEAKWRAESDLRTLVEAKAIRADDKRYKAAMKCGRDQMKNLKAAMKEE